VGGSRDPSIRGQARRLAALPGLKRLVRQFRAIALRFVNILDTIDGTRRAFEIAGRGCLVRISEDEPRYATVAEVAARLEPHPDATMLLTAVSEAVERYDPSREAAILLEVASGYQVLILSPEGYDYVGGLTFEGYGLLGLVRD
jgi:hypothetical protein